MIHIVLLIANSVIGKSALPDFFCVTNDRSEGVRVSALDQLNSVFDGNLDCGRKKKMDVFGHNDKGVNLEAAFAAITVKSL